MYLHHYNCVYFLEPVKLIGEGQYNLNQLKEIKVTDYYLGMDQDVKECQNNEPFYQCTTKYYLNTAMEKCGCLPINMNPNKGCFSEKCNIRDIPLTVKEFRPKNNIVLQFLRIYPSSHFICH